MKGKKWYIHKEIMVLEDWFISKINYWKLRHSNLFSEKVMYFT